jgi:hypothetical protein
MSDIVPLKLTENAGSIVRYGNEASRPHSGCDAEQSGEPVSTSALLLYFIRIPALKSKFDTISAFEIRCTLNLYEKNSYESVIGGGVIVITHRQDAK